MKIQKLLFIFLAPVIVEVAIACQKCSETVYRRYTNKSVSVDHLDNSGDKLIVSTSGLLSKRDYGIQVGVHGEELASRENWIPSFFGSAYALDCPPLEEFIPVDNVMGIRVITLNDFDAGHPANYDVSDSFKVYDVLHNSLETIDTYLWNTRDERYSMELLVNLLLMSPPTEGGAHRFKVLVTLSDGRVLEGEGTSIGLTD